MEIDQLWLPVDTLAAALDQQIKAQTSKEYLAGLLCRRNIKVRSEQNGADFLF